MSGSLQKNVGRRANDDKVLVLCPNELRMLYFISDQSKKLVVDLSTAISGSPEARDIALNIDALMSQGNDIVLEMKKKMGVG
jgi:hypothetical protein